MKTIILISYSSLSIGIAFERVKDSSSTCFKRILNFLFGKDGQSNLRNVHVHSDRGYMIPTIVFEYLIANGAEVCGTVKRMAQCWPFTYNQALKPSDKRTLVDVKGAPTLFLKWCKAGVKYLFASAFRNGSESVATAVSTLHTQHHWEGIVMEPNELVEYKVDKTSLQSKFFQRVHAIDDEFELSETEGEKNLLNQLLNHKVEAYTLRQGKFKMRI